MLTTPRSSYLTPLAAALLLAVAAVPAWSQSTGPSASTATATATEDVDALRDDVTRLREEVAALRAAIDDIRGTMPRATSSSTTQQVASPAALEMLKSQVEQHEQSKVSSSSRLPVRLFGAIVANTFVNSGDANWLENPNIVGNATADGASSGSMSATVRQSRVGLETNGIVIGDWQASATMVADFLGGVSNFGTGTAMGLPRLLYAFGRLERGNTAVQIGQDHVILAPREPTSLAAMSFPLLFRSGNLYLRAPQVRVEQRIGGAVTVTSGIVAPLAGDNSTFEFAPAAGAGERSRRPAVEARAAFARGDADATRAVSVGVSAHGGWRRVGGAVTNTWAVAFDGDMHIGRIGAAGEIYAADNAEPFGGGIAQGGRAAGGWAEMRVRLAPRTRAVGGFGLDRPRDPFGRVTRTENRSGFGNVIVDLTPEVAASVEYRWLRTSFGPFPTRANQHINGVLAIRF
jgi:hypothetical protein